jgi:pimeloyl-ACP methyl ester carboxylesterase
VWALGCGAAAGRRDDQSVRITLELADLRLRGGGTGDGPALLLLHGLGATGEVWDGLLPLVDDHWPGQWLAPDLPGHGGSRRLRAYSYGTIAAAVAGAIAAREVVVLGHSFGGAIGAVLASGWFGVDVRSVIALGVKVRWTADETARMAALAERPVQWFDEPADAVDRHLRVSGLTDLVDPTEPAARAGVVAADGRWRLALDPAVYGVGAPDIEGFRKAARAPIHWVRGEHDRLVPDADLPAGHLTLAGLGHNAHVEDPAAVWAVIGDLSAELDGKMPA